MIELLSDDHSTAEAIYARYVERLCALASDQIRPDLQRRFGADDIVQSVFRTFFRRATSGEFNIAQSESLWRLLVQITLRKVCKQVEFHQADKRSVQAEVAGDHEAWQSRLTASEPGPAEAAALTDELAHLASQLQAPEPQILQLCLQGYSTPEIADRLGCSRWTVRRVLDRIGHLLEQRLHPE